MSQDVAPGSLRLVFDAGTVLIEGLPEGADLGLPGTQFDHRTRQFRAPAMHYKAIVQHLLDEKIAFTDGARDYQKASWKIRVKYASRLSSNIDWLSK